MNELYWISVLGNLAMLTEIMLGITTAAFVCAFAWILSSLFNDDDKSTRINAWKFVRYTLPFFVLAVVVHIFIPSKKDLYMIYGIGTTIDFIQESPTGKQLPQKTLDCLNKFLDDYLDKEE